ncbi:hypothetical protein DEU56DRAFT_752822 [Suillus clintonianus]|uniref:uncharacterized protein n=1 Tax=Suillus clintonianus TaxID=1904413 RepID=UPI001B871F0C|nr:uncharacterized protein DEU56DRAFT_752822 [Suillus clintonianus]KAG2149150.1 hypothetical protein DEU56DRAFT_752822 [Suillus clintonianus]
MAKTRHGIRSARARAKQDARVRAYRDHDPAKVKAAIEQDLHIHRIRKFPSDFLAIQRSGALLISLPEYGKILLPLDHLPADTIPAGMPPHLAIRYEHFLSADHQRRLQRRWDDVRASDAGQHLKCDTNRSNADGYHFGIWEVTGKMPRLTAETHKQSAKAQEAINALLFYVQTFIAPKIGTAFEEHAPNHWAAMLKAHARVQKCLRRRILERPITDMGGPFFALAVKESGSGLIHIDWNDNRAIYAYIFAVGDWEGGEFCIPQLGIKIPVRPGQVLAVLARVVAHFSAPVTTGRRIVRRGNLQSVSARFPVHENQPAICRPAARSYVVGAHAA